MQYSGVTFLALADAQVDAVLQEIADPQVNMERIKLHKAPRIACIPQE